MKELVCITCPMGCHLSVTIPANETAAVSPADIVVTGNRCPRGVVYAREELLAPRRTVTATCRILFPADESGAEAGQGGKRRLPVRTKAAFPREKVDELLSLLYAMEVPLPVERGQVLLADALGTGIDVIATRSIGFRQ